MSPGGLVPAAAGAAKTRVRGRPPAHAAKAAPRRGSLQLPYLRGRAAGPEGPGVLRGRRAAEQVGAADVMAGQLAAGGARPAALLEERVGEAGSRPAGCPSVGHRDNGGLLQAHSELSLCGHGSTPPWGKGVGNYPFWKCLVPLPLRSTTPLPSRMPESASTASTATKTTLLLPVETQSTSGWAPPHWGCPGGSSAYRHHGRVPTPSPGSLPITCIRPREPVLATHRAAVPAAIPEIFCSQ